MLLIASQKKGVSGWVFGQDTTVRAYGTSPDPLVCW